MSASPVHLDQSPASIVITCDLCPWWAGVRLTRDDARECAENHELNTHPEMPSRFRAARQMREMRARHAAGITIRA